MYRNIYPCSQRLFQFKPLHLAKCGESRNVRQAEPRDEQFPLKFQNPGTTAAGHYSHYECSSESKYISSKEDNNHADRMSQKRTKILLIQNI